MLRNNQVFRAVSTNFGGKMILIADMESGHSFLAANQRQLIEKIAINSIENDFEPTIEELWIFRDGKPEKKICDKVVSIIQNNIDKRVSELKQIIRDNIKGQEAIVLDYWASVI